MEQQTNGLTSFNGELPTDRSYESVKKRIEIARELIRQGMSRGEAAKTAHVASTTLISFLGRTRKKYRARGTTKTQGDHVQVAAPKPQPTKTAGVTITIEIPAQKLHIPLTGNSWLVEKLFNK